LTRNATLESSVIGLPFKRVYFINYKINNFYLLLPGKLQTLSLVSYTYQCSVFLVNSQDLFIFLILIYIKIILLPQVRIYFAEFLKNNSLIVFVFLTNEPLSVIDWMYIHNFLDYDFYIYKLHRFTFSRLILEILYLIKVYQSNLLI